MLDWGAPHLLWILPAVWLAALVLHLYFRRRRMVVRFSDLEFCATNTIRRCAAGSGTF